MLNRKTFQHALQELCADYQNKKFLLAISGGADSMVLLHLFKESNLKFEVAHLNYKLRDGDSEDDQILVERICRINKIPFHLYSISEKDSKPENSIQDWARIIRYEFFRKIQKEQNLDFIATAHHLNDQLETFIINLSKASGIKGLSGIPANQNNILRPLLSLSKEEIYTYANDHKVEFREDLSNQKNDYLRNSIRNQIVPKLLEVNDNFLENFGKSISYLRQGKDFIDEKILEIEKKIITNVDDYSTLSKKLFLNQSPFVQFEMLRKFGFNDVEEISKISKAKTGKKFISSGYELTVDREILIIGKIVNQSVKSADEEVILNLDIDNQLIIPEQLQVEIKELGTLDWKFEGEKIQMPLKLRRRKQSDFFHPIGMIGKKKMSKFFKDEKIPILAQQKTWLLCDGNDRILGVIPFRQDGRFAATNASSKIVKIKL